jgi:hypothetical protein
MAGIARELGEPHPPDVLAWTAAGFSLSHKKEATENQAPACGAFLLAGATWCKTLYRWLHGGYMVQRRKKPAIV